MSTVPNSDAPAPSDPTTGSASRRRRIFGRIAYAIFLTLIVEGSLQLFYRASSGDWLFRRVALPIYASDTYRGWTVRPNLHFRHTTNEFSVDYITNSQGFRTDDPARIYARPKPPGIYRILLMGPSFAFGWANSYPDTLGACIERSLWNAPELKGRAVEVINAGVPSLAWPAQQQWYDHVGRTYEPDLVILVHYADVVLSGDFDNVSFYHVNDEGYLVTAKIRRWSRLRIQAKRSAAIFYGYMAGQRIVGAVHNRLSEPIEPSTRPANTTPRFNPSGNGVIVTRQRLETFRDHATSEGRTIMLVHVPLAYNVHRQDAKRWGIPDDRRIQDTIDINVAACRYFQETTGVPCLDLIDAFEKQAAQNRDRLYYRLDPHCTPLGNRIAAEAVAETIRESLGKK